VRAPGEIREARVFIRAEEQSAERIRSGALGELLRLVPDSAGVYRAWQAPPADRVTDLIVRKIVAPGPAPSGPDRSAPSVSSLDGGAGGEGDYESLIDRAPLVRAAAAYQTAALAPLVDAGPVTSMLHVESTGAGSDAIFVNRGSVVVLARQGDWPSGAARTALRTVVAPMWTKGQIGLDWSETRQGAHTVWQLTSLDSIFVAERGSLLFLATDPALLAQSLDAMARPPLAVEGSFAGGFRHAAERQRFVQIMRGIDRSAASEDARGPRFFTDNLGSLSETLARVETASLVVREAPDRVSETMTYRVAR
jgi:hypothetical protein